MDPNVLALVMGLVTLVALVGLFLYFSNSRKTTPAQPQSPVISVLSRDQIVALYSQIILGGLDHESHDEILNRLDELEEDIDGLKKRQDTQNQTNANVQQQLNELKDGQGLLRKDVDLLSRDHDNLALAFNRHGHDGLLASRSSIRRSWIFAGLVLGFIAGVVFNLLVDDGTVLGNVYNSNNDQWTVIIATTAALTVIGALAGLVASAFVHNGKTTRPQQSTTTNTQITVTHPHTTVR